MRVGGDIRVVLDASFTQAVRRQRRIRCHLRPGVNGSTAGARMIEQLALFDDPDSRTRGVGDFLHPFRNKVGRGWEIQLQGLNQFLSFYNGREILSEVFVEVLGSQAVIVVLEHERCGEKLLERGLVEKRLTLRAGSSLRHASEYPASR